MKISKVLLFGVVACFGITQLFGQTAASTSAIKSFGIGLHVEQFKYNDVSDFNSAPANKIVLTFNPSSSFRIEPEVGFRSGKNTTSNLKNSSINLGLGLFSMSLHNKLNFYYGLRLEYANIQYEDHDSEFSGYGTKTISHATNRFSIGPAIGCEYFLGDNFTFGGEVAIKYASLETTESPKASNYKAVDSNYFTTDAGLFVRFYF
jgi:hypothetical protein